MMNAKGRELTMTKASEVFNRHKSEILKIASRYPVANIRVFGSIIHGKDNESSDIDLLVDALPEATLFDLGGLQDELQELLGIQVDLLTPGDLPPQFRTTVINEARTV